MDVAIGKRPENVPIIGRASSLKGYCSNPTQSNITSTITTKRDKDQTIEQLLNEPDETIENNEIEPVAKRVRKTKTPEWFSQLNDAKEHVMHLKICAIN